jgi:hypothetical protein
MQHVIKKNVNILDTKFAGTLILDFQTPELWQINIKLLCRWHFVIAAWTDHDNIWLTEYSWQS